MAEVAAEGPLLPSTNQAQNSKPMGQQRVYCAQVINQFLTRLYPRLASRPIGLPDLY